MLGTLKSMVWFERVVGLRLSATSSLRPSPPMAMGSADQDSTPLLGAPPPPKVKRFRGPRRVRRPAWKSAYSTPDSDQHERRPTRRNGRGRVGHQMPRPPPGRAARAKESHRICGSIRGPPHPRRAGSPGEASGRAASPSRWPKRERRPADHQQFAPTTTQLPPAHEQAPPAGPRFRRPGRAKTPARFRLGIDIPSGRLYCPLVVGMGKPRVAKALQSSSRPSRRTVSPRRVTELGPRGELGSGVKRATCIACLHNPGWRSGYVAQGRAGALRRLPADVGGSARPRGSRSSTSSASPATISRTLAASTLRAGQISRSSTGRRGASLFGGRRDRASGSRVPLGARARAPAPAHSGWSRPPAKCDARLSNPSR